jgi:hypothetical protein
MTLIFSNPGVNTIEEQLISALYKAEAITEDCKINPGKVIKHSYILVGLF